MVGVELGVNAARNVDNTKERSLKMADDNAQPMTADLTKVGFDSACLHAVTCDLARLSGSKIQRIVQPDSTSVVLSVYHPACGELWWLLDLSPAMPRTYLLSRKRSGSGTPPAFCMTLRKYLEGGRIVSVTQRGFDRILDAEVIGLEGRRYLLTAEFMGRHSNLLLVDDHDVILHVLRPVPRRLSRYREALPGRPYVAPPLRNRLNPLLPENWKAIDLPAEPSEWMEALDSQFEGIGRMAAHELAYLASQSVSGTEYLSRAQELFSRLASGPAVVIRRADGRVAGAWPVPPSSIPSERLSIRESIHVALEYAFGAIQEKERLEQRRRSLHGMLVRNLERRQQALEQLDRGAREVEHADRYRLYGEMLLAQPLEVPEGADTVSLINLYEPDTRLDVQLDPTLTVHENAERYFERARRAVKTAARYAGMRDEMRDAVLRLRDAIARVESAEHMEQLETIHRLATTEGWLSQQEPVRPAAETRSEFEGRRISRYTSPDGYETLVGENALANDYLVQRVARPDDWWLHVRGGVSAHVVIRTAGKPERVPKRTLEWAAALAVRHSASKHSSLTAVDYTLRKYVRRPRKGAPGFVTYTHEKTLHVGE